MATYQYEAFRLTDKTRVTGVISADSEQQAREILREQELVPTQLKQPNFKGKSIGGGNGAGSLDIGAWFEQLQGVSSKEKTAFTRNLGMMLKSGIAMTEALTYLETYLGNAPFKKMVSTIRGDILTGSSFSKALTRHSKLFNTTYTSIMRAGEAAGELDAVLERLTSMQERAEKLKMEVVRALAYPVIVIFIMILVLLLMFLLIIPKFQEMYSQMGVKLPTITLVMIGISDFMRHFWFIFFPAMGGLCYAAIQYFKSISGKSQLDAFLLKVPVVKRLVIFGNAANFLSTMSVAFSAGVPITEGLYLGAQTIGNVHLKQGILQVNLQIQAGQRLAASLAASGTMPDLVIAMVSTGEQSGEMEKMLDAAFDYVDAEVAQIVALLTTLMEPLLMLVLGAITAAMALSIYLPLFNMYGNMH